MSLRIFWHEQDSHLNYTLVSGFKVAYKPPIPHRGKRVDNRKCFQSDFETMSSVGCRVATRLETSEGRQSKMCQSGQLPQTHNLLSHPIGQGSSRFALPT
jgi:hypothetical protein